MGGSTLRERNTSVITLIVSYFLIAPSTRKHEQLTYKGLLLMVFYMLINSLMLSAHMNKLFTYRQEVNAKEIHQINSEKKNFWRVETVWDRFLFGRVVTVARMMIAIVMAMRHQCGLSRLIRQLIVVKMRIMTSKLILLFKKMHLMQRKSYNIYIRRIPYFL